MTNYRDKEYLHVFFPIEHIKLKEPSSSWLAGWMILSFTLYLIRFETVLFIFLDDKSRYLQHTKLNKVTRLPLEIPDITKLNPQYSTKLC